MEETRKNRLTRRLSGKIAVVYAVFGALWIFFSNRVAEGLSQTSQAFAQFERIKGLAYVLLTALLLYHLVSRGVKRLEASQDAFHNCEEKYRTIVEATETGCAILDQQGKVLEANLHYAKLSEHNTSQEILGRSVTEWTAAYDVGRITEEIRKCGEKNCTRNLRIDYQGKSGNIIPIEMNSTSLHSGDDKVILAMCVDVSERKRAEETLKESEMRFRAIFEHTAVGVAQVGSHDGRFFRVNKKFCDITGYSREELLGRDFQSITHPDDREVSLKNAARLFAGEIASYTMEKRYIHRSGAIVWVNITISPLWEAGEEQNFHVGVVEDITGRKLAEEALRESEERFSKFFRASPVGTSTTRLSDGQFADINDAFLDLFGYTREEVIGQTPLTLNMWANPEDRAKMVELLDKQGRVRELETQFRRKSGEVRDVRVSAEVIEVAGRRYILGLTHDITERKRAEDTLRESEEQFRTLVESAPDAIFIQLEGRFSYVNDAVIRLYGAASEKELLGHDILERIHPDYRAKILERIQLTNEKRKPSPLMEQRHLKLDGTTIDVETHAVPIRYLKSEGGLVFARDITERKKTEDSLLLSEDRYRRLFEDAVLGIFRSTPEGKIINVNPAFARMFGFDSPEETKILVNDVAVDLYADPSRRNELLRLILDAEGPISAETRYRRKDGNIFTGNLHAWTVRGKKGKLSYIEGFVEDITQRRNAEEERLRLEKAIEQIAEGIMIADANFIVRYANPAFEQITGYGRREIIGQHTSLLKSDEHDRAFYEEIQQTLQRGDVWSGRVRSMKKDGTSYEVEALTSPVRDESGTITNYIGIRRDITREVRLENELHQAQKMEAIGTLAGGIAHDFNNLLAPIIGYAEMILLNTPDLNPTRRGLEQILKAAIRAGELVKQILALSHFTPEQEMIPVEIGSVAIEALKLLRSSLPSTIEIRQSIDNSVAMADATQIHQVLLNLCTNAAHAMDGKGVLEVGLSRVHLSESDLANESIIEHEPGPYIRLRVADTGSGMDARTLERIFDPYFTTKQVGKGSGLGLAVVHGIVKRHGGAVTVQSEPGKGAAFCIYLPAMEMDNGVVVEAGEALPRGTERILLIDDEQIVVEMGTAILEELGYTVTSETDSPRALEIFRSRLGEFDLIITDYTMPKLTGTDLSKEIRRIQPGVPILLCTGFSEKITAEGAVDLGVELVMKPFSMKQIAQSIRRALEARES